MPLVQSALRFCGRLCCLLSIRNHFVPPGLEENEEYGEVHCHELKHSWHDRSYDEQTEEGGRDVYRDVQERKEGEAGRGKSDNDERHDSAWGGQERYVEASARHTARNA